MRRAPLVALGVTALFAGLWGGLLRLGLPVPGGGATSRSCTGR